MEIIGLFSTTIPRRYATRPDVTSRRFREFFLSTIRLGTEGQLNTTVVSPRLEFVHLSPLANDRCPQVKSMNVQVYRNRQCHLYLCQFLLKISSDCHPNPGPRPPKFPCLKCRKAVKNGHASVQCETCEQWGHVECLGITDVRFEVLVDYSFAWICPVCDSQNVTQRSSSDTSDISLTTTESSRSSEQDVSIQDHSIDLNSSQTYDDIPCSTPKKTLQGTVKKNSLSCIVVNTQSILSKKESLWQVLETEAPDIIIACETWLKPDVHDSEVIPTDLEYDIFRKDRVDG